MGIGLMRRACSENLLIAASVTYYSCYSMCLIHKTTDRAMQIQVTLQAKACRPPIQELSFQRWMANHGPSSNRLPLNALRRNGGTISPHSRHHEGLPSVILNTSKIGKETSMALLQVSNLMSPRSSGLVSPPILRKQARINRGDGERTVWCWGAARGGGGSADMTSGG